ncbi:MAG: hypothetical protein LBN39_04600 [Planctomycetaceae bacterium]|nr:hypothetical protein [Planctomycetaceae bacterium]
MTSGKFTIAAFLGTKYADWFLDVKIPKQILRPDAAGFSSITVNGAE